MAEVPKYGDETPFEGLELPRFEDGRPMLLAGLRGDYTMATMREIPALWQIARTDQWRDLWGLFSFVRWFRLYGRGRGTKCGAIT